MARRSLYREEVKESIASAALQLLKTKPFAEIKIEEIMNLAGFTKGTFYQYFDRKEALFEYIVSMAAERFRMMLTTVQDRARDGGEAIDMLLHDIISAKAENSCLWRIFASSIGEDAKVRIRLVDRLVAFISMFGGHASPEAGMLMLGTFLCIWMSDKQVDIDKMKHYLYNALFIA